MDSITTTRQSSALHPAGRRDPSRAPERASATVFRADHSTDAVIGVMLTAEDSEAPRSRDDLASKFEAMRVDHECATRRARGLEEALVREAAWYG